MSAQSSTLASSSSVSSSTLSGGYTYSDDSVSASSPSRRGPLPAVKGTIGAINSPRSRSAFEYDESELDLASTLRSQSQALSPTPTPTRGTSQLHAQSTPLEVQRPEGSAQPVAGGGRVGGATGCGVVFTPDPTVRSTLERLPLGNGEVARLFGV